MSEFKNVQSTEQKIELPSRFSINQVVKIQFVNHIESLLGTIRGIHFYPGKVKYDIGIWLDGSNEDHLDETRIYNIDSVFLKEA